jgi:hypothetical protein
VAPQVRGRPAPRRRADDEGGVGDRVLERVEELDALDERLGAVCDAGDAVGAEVVGPDEAQAGQAHVHHGAQRGGDVDHVLRAVEHDDEPFCVGRCGQGLLRHAGKCPRPWTPSSKAANRQSVRCRRPAGAVHDHDPNVPADAVRPVPERDGPHWWASEWRAVAR